MKYLAPWLTCLILIFSLTEIAFSQVTNASLNGIVTDPTGAAIPDARITVQNTGTNLTVIVKSNSSGLYSVTPLPPGQYSIAVERSGFQKTIQNGIKLTIGQVATVNISLPVGSKSETVTVKANEELINTTSAEISNVFNERDIKELPLNGRDPSSLVFLSPGVTNVLQSRVGFLQASDSSPQETGASAGGGRQGSTYYLLDGVPNMDTYLNLAAPFPNADATQEFRVITNNFDAQYGFSPGAVVSIDTKSGTNEFHGGLFEFIRNNDLNAGNYFTHFVDSLKRNQFGGYLGGPIKKNRLFFFVNYQGTRETTAASTNVTFDSTAAMLRGDFSAVPMTLGAPFTTIDGKPNQVNPSLLSPGAIQISETALPLGQDPATGQVNFISAPNNDSYNEGTGRLDYVISEKQRVFARSFMQIYTLPAGNINGNILATTLASEGKYYNEVVGDTWTINPTLVNVISAAWIRNDFLSGNEVYDNSGQPFCLSRYVNVSDPPGTCYTEGLSVANGFNGPYAEPNRNVRVTWWLADSITKSYRDHLFTAGFNLYHQWGDTLTDYPAQPSFNFNGYVTGFGLADFLLGDVSSFTQGSFENAPISGWKLGLYGQDQYRVKPNVTLTAGIRWEPDFAPESLNGGSAFIPGEQSQRYPNAPTGLVFPGDPGVPQNLRPSSYGYYEPRIGIAWQPLSLPRTAFRGGFGLFVAPLQDENYNIAVGVAPFAPTYTLNASTSNPISFQNPWAGYATTGGKSPFPPFTQNPNLPASQAVFLTPLTLPSSFAQNFRLGVTQSWTVSVEQQLSREFALHLAYVGSESYHQAANIDLNPGIYAEGGNRGKYPLFGQILQSQSIGTASYHSLQAGIEKQFSKGLQFQSNFTWAKGIDLVSGLSGPDGLISLGDPFDLSWNRGISDINIPLSSVSNFVYTTPSLSGRNQVVRQILGAWEVSGIWTLQSGQPFSINGGNGNNNSGSLQYGDRANVVAGQPYNVHRGSRAQWLTHYFNSAAFVPNPPGTFGNSGRNILQGPGIDSGDIGLIKNFQLDGKYHLQFRWEMFNALNHPSFGLPVTNPTASNFGQITGIGAISPRVMQGALKFSF